MSHRSAEWRDKDGRTAKDIERSLPLDLGHIPTPPHPLERENTVLKRRVAEGNSTIEQLRDQRHSLCVALMAAEATLGFLANATKGVPYREDRRAESYRIVREALASAGYQL